MWQGIYGHDQLVERFQRSLASGRLPSSFLFLGPEGIGKRTFAIKLAKALLCPKGAPEKLMPCGTCDSCRQLDAGNHPDLDIVGLPEDKREIPLKTFIGDKEHRNQEGLCHQIALRPMLGKRRVAIIDDADYLNIESSNCLLKTLEEPPPGAVLILIGTSRGRQLPTILSRTQVVRFQPLAPEVVAQLLVEQGIAENAYQAEALAAASGGSLHRALQLQQLNLADFTERFVRQLAAEPLDVMRCVGVLNDFVNEAGTVPEARRQRLRLAFGVATEHFRGQLRVNLRDLSRQDAVIRSLDRTLQAEEDLDRNANQATLLECWIDEIASYFEPSQVGS